MPTSRKMYLIQEAMKRNKAIVGIGGAGTEIALRAFQRDMKFGVIINGRSGIEQLAYMSRLFDNETQKQFMQQVEKLYPGQKEEIDRTLSKLLAKPRLEGENGER